MACDGLAPIPITFPLESILSYPIRNSNPSIAYLLETFREVLMVWHTLLVMILVLMLVYFDAGLYTNISSGIYIFLSTAIQV